MRKGDQSFIRNAFITWYRDVYRFGIVDCGVSKALEVDVAG